MAAPRAGAGGDTQCRDRDRRVAAPSWSSTTSRSGLNSSTTCRWGRSSGCRRGPRGPWSTSARRPSGSSPDRAATRCWLKHRARCPGRRRPRGCQTRGVAVAGLAPRRSGPARAHEPLGAAVTRSGLAIRIVGPDECDVLGNPPTLVWQSTRAQRVRVTVHAAATMAMVAQAELDGDRWAAQAPLPPGLRLAGRARDRRRVAVRWRACRVVDGEAARSTCARRPPTSRHGSHGR